MRHYLLGLELSMALAMLKSEGVEPQVTVTRAPKRQDDANCTMRVVYASDDGKELTVSAFVDPIAEGLQENG
ncbi:MAG: hypothetical protein IJ381_00710 [Clostridia bacterium]|nr:hypothetical protein [Clostridia bacterium]